MIPIVIIAVVLILFMVLFMTLPTPNDYSKPHVGYKVLGEAHEPGSEHRVLAVQYGKAETFLVYNSLRTLGRWNLFCGNEYMKTRQHRPGYAIGFNLSMELQQFLDNAHTAPQVSLEELLKKFPESNQDTCEEVYRGMIKTNELSERKFTKELQNTQDTKTAASVMKSNFTCKNDYTKLYHKKVTLGSTQFDVNYMKVTLVENSSNDEFILYYIDYTIDLPKFSTGRYNAPIYIEYKDGILNQYGMNKPWVNPYSYVPQIVEHPEQASVSSDDRSITSNYVFIGDTCNNMWPLSDITT